MVWEHIQYCTIGHIKPCPCDDGGWEPDPAEEDEIAIIMSRSETPTDCPHCWKPGTLCSCGETPCEKCSLEHHQHQSEGDDAN